jgi:acyl carrier protein
LSQAHGYPENRLSTPIAAVEETLTAMIVKHLSSQWLASTAEDIEINSATNLVSDLTMDSFAVMEYLMEIEDHYDIAIDLNSISNAHTVRDLARIVVSLKDG